MRKVLIAVAILLLLAAATVVGGILHVRSVKPDYDQAIAGARVAEPVEIWRDSAGVPHVWAHSEADLYFAQGYTHAQERLWQMELFRRVGEGRLSEVFGESMLDTDKFLRTMGLWRAAALNEARLTPEARRLMEAYVAGVNLWIDRHEGPLPPEFTILRIKPEHWQVRNTLAIEKIMSLDLSLYESAAALTQAVRRIGVEKAKWLQPSDPAWGPTIVATPRITGKAVAFAEVPQMPRAAAELLDALSITRASN
ncbi:MAG TPA: penicillin acylase family protein, partial [Longimicrobiales bacterium]